MVASPALRKAQSKNFIVFRLATTFSAAGLVGVKMKVGETIGQAPGASRSVMSTTKPADD
jgi:hypothetical protein